MPHPPPGGEQPGSTPMPPPPPAGLTPPPGYQSYSAAPTPLAKLHRVGGLATWGSILVGLAGAAAVLTAVVSPSASDKAEQFLNDEISEQQFLDSYAAFGSIQLLQNAITLAAGIVTIIWLYRLASNARAFQRATTWAPIWAVFAWILPPVLVIIPALMVREVWKASNPEVPAGSDAWKQGDENPIVFVWFVVYGVVPAILTAVAFNSLFGGGFGGEPEDLAKAIEGFGAIELIGTAASVIAAGVWIVVVRQLTARHVRLTNER